ncbi:MAG: hypothetical protein IKS59_05270 [Aeriscardovia sp.]|nr:hypothetical protein [Aeriscardovia sp.]
MSSNMNGAQNIENQPKKHHAGATIVVTIIVIAVLGLISAFIWPGWAVKSNTASQATSQQAANQTPKIAAIALPANSTNLLKAMPADVGAYARQQITNTSVWSQTLPLEEHKIVYSTGDSSQNITLLVGQWALANNAQSVYSSLAAKLTGNKIASGDVKVNGQKTGTYQVNEAADNANQAVAIWQNSTCIFEISGPTSAVKSFYQEFPL